MNCGAMRPGFIIPVGARSISVCEKSFGLREEFRIARSVWDCEKCFGFVRIGRLSNWDVRVLVIFEIVYPRVLSFFFEGTKNHCYFVKMQMRKSESADLFHLKIQLFCVFFKAVTASINGNYL